MSLLLLRGGQLLAAEYYVDFDGGSDGNPGTSTSSAWKHCPGDANATGTAGSTALGPGDVVRFKGGVSYHGTIRFNWSGNGSNRIVYDGNSEGNWGMGRAIMNGSLAISTPWTRCSDASDCRDNPNYANIYWTTVPAGVSNGWPQLLIDGTTQTFTAQTPNPTNRYIFDLVTTWLQVESNYLTSTSIQDVGRLGQSSSDYWNGAWVGVWGTGNSMHYRAITGFSPITDTINFAPVSVYTDRTSYYSLFNHPALIDAPGEHAVDVANNRLYVWPPDSADPSNHVWSVGHFSNGFLGASKHDVTVRGFAFRGYFSDVNTVGYGGCAIQFSGAGSTNLTVADCDIRNMRSMDRDWIITVPNASGRNIVNNTIADSYGGGIYSGGAGIVIFSNYLSQITGTAIYVPSCTNGVIASNHLSTVVGTHANGITLYTHAESTVVSHNYIRNVYAPFTYQNSHNLTFINNLVDAAGEDQRINTWGGNSGHFKWLNNTFINNPNHMIMQIGGDGTNVTHTVKNNIIDGGGSWAGMVGSHANNVYVGLVYFQSSEYGWSLGSGERVSTPARVFLGNGNWRLKDGSPAIGTGANLSSFGFSNDLVGTERTNGWDVGCFSFGGPNLLPVSPLNLHSISPP